MSKKITVVFDEQGNPTVTVNGVAGSACLKETAALEAALGRVKSVEKTRDYSRTETTNNIKQRG